jgi:hypothetical protein
MHAPNLTAVATGGACFWLVAIFLIPMFMTTLDAAMLYMAFTVSGCIVGALAARAPLLHGILLALLTGVLIAGFPAIFGDQALVRYLSPLDTLVRHVALAAMPGLILCPLGALIGQILVSRGRGL